MKHPLRGIIPPMVTPLLKNGALDSQGLRKLIEHMLTGGVHGIFLLGTTGEGPSLEHSLRKQLVAEACALINKRVPVLVCITDTSSGESLEMAAHAKQMGADFLVIASPYYFPISQEEMQDYLEHLVPKLPLPFLIYNMPSCTKLHLSLETIKKAKQLGAIGIKDSSGDLDFLNVLLNEFGTDPNFTILTGTELHLPQVIAKGGHGTVAGGANFFPKIFVDYYKACLSDDSKMLRHLEQKVSTIGRTIYNVGKEESRYVKGTKCVLAAMDICDDYTALPLRPFDATDRAKIKQYVDELSRDNTFSITE